MFRTPTSRCGKAYQFHGGYGEMTAVDVAFSWNDANPKIQPDSVHDTGGDLANLVREVEVIDDYKVRFHWVAFGGHALLQYVSNFWEGISIFSRASSMKSARKGCVRN